MLRLNVGNLDRLLRVLIGLVLVGFAVAGMIGPWGYLGVVFVATGAVAFCPLYSLLRLATTSR